MDVVDDAFVVSDMIQWTSAFILKSTDTTTTTLKEEHMKLLHLRHATVLFLAESGTSLARSRQTTWGCPHGSKVSRWQDLLALVTCHGDSIGRRIGIYQIMEHTNLVRSEKVWRKVDYSILLAVFVVFLNRLEIDREYGIESVGNSRWRRSNGTESGWYTVGDIRGNS